MNKGIFAAMLVSAFATNNLFAQVGNDNPTGVAGELENSGIVTTGCHYNAYTGNAKRSVTDIVVAGSVGAYPLEFTRTSNSRYALEQDDGGNQVDLGSAGNWLHSYQWTLQCKWPYVGGRPTTYTVSYPDGQVVTFAAATNGDPYWRGGKGVRDRLQLVWDTNTSGRAYVIRPDGGKVWFSISKTAGNTLQGIIDPFGQTTTISGSPANFSPNPTGLVTITEPGGRWIKLYYVQTGNPWFYVIDHLTASDGRTIQYGYTLAGHTISSLDPWLSQVTYFNDPSLVATYSYQAPNVPGADSLLRTCVDPMYAGPMWKIAYTYAIGTNADGTPVVYGQILSENYFDGTNIGAAVSTLAVTGAKTRKETRADGKTRTFTYDTNTPPLLVSWTDFKGNPASQTYDTNGYVNALADFNNHTTNFTKNNFTGGLLTKTFPSTPGDTPPGTPRGVVIYTYGSASCADANNRDANNPYYVCTATDEGGHVTSYTRDTARRITQVSYPDGGSESFQYNSFGQITSHTMRAGGLETFEYDARGLPQKYRDAYHAVPSNPSFWYTYDSLDRLSGITDALGTGAGDINHTTNYTYNLRGQRLVLTHPVDGQRHTVTRTYNTDGSLASVADELNHPTSLSYDAYRRVRSLTTPGHGALLATYVFYDSNGTGEDYTHTDSNPTWVVSPSGKKTKDAYDENYRMISVTEAFGSTDAAITGYGYDNVGNLTSIVSPNEQPGEMYSGFSTVIAYDERNRQMSIRDAQSNLTTVKYDAGGHLASATRPNGQGITYDSYDAMNRLQQQTVKQTPDPDAVTKYTYYTSGLLQTMKDPRLVAINSTEAYTYHYDLMGRQDQLTYPRPDVGSNQTTELWHYDTAGRVDTFTNRNAKIATITWDGLNRPTVLSWNDSLTPSVSYGYDPAFRLVSSVNSNATISRMYFDDNLLNTETTTYADNTPRTVTYTYDQDYNRGTIQYPNGAYSLTYQYTGRNQLQNLINNAGGGTVASYNYDKNGNLRYRSMDNNTNSTFMPDVLDRITHIAHSLNGTTRTFDYGYSSVGDRLWTKRDGGNGDVFGYDLNEQSTSALLNVANPDTTAAGLQTIGYDANGNRTAFSPYGSTDTYTTNNLNQYTVRNSAMASYDPNGNLLAAFDASNYIYDAQNRLITASKGGTTETFKYDGLGRQISRTIGSASPVYNVYDGWELIGEYAPGSNAPNNAYLLGSNELVKNLTTNQYYYQDALGSTSHLADNAGALLEWYRYDLHGTPFVNGDPSNHTSSFSVRHLFNGEQWYGEIGMYDLRFRAYSPDIGRFLQTDPIRFFGDPTNLYRYVQNNPQNWQDPLGLSTLGATGAPAKNPDPNYVLVTGSPVPGGFPQRSAAGSAQGSSGGSTGSGGEAFENRVVVTASDVNAESRNGNFNNSISRIQNAPTPGVPSLPREIHFWGNHEGKNPWNGVVHGDNHGNNYGTVYGNNWGANFGTVIGGLNYGPNLGTVIPPTGSPSPGGP